MKHIPESDLALLAGGDLPFVARIRANHHLRRCPECQGSARELSGLRNELLRAGASDLDADLALPGLQWQPLATEMRANIRLGLEAGACVSSDEATPRFNPRVAVAFASLCLVVASGFFFRSRPVHAPEAAAQGGSQVVTMLAATGGGLELRSGANTLTLLNHHGAVADQTVGPEGEIGARFVDSETGSVTINNVYLPE